MENLPMTQRLVSKRTVFSFWPFLLWTVPFAAVYGLGALGYENVCGRVTNEAVAMPLVFVSVASFGALAWKRRDEFAMALAVLSLGFFLREWHFAGTSEGVYVVVTGVAGWFVLRRRHMQVLIKNTPTEVWLWATALCYMMSQLIARRVFGQDHLGWIPLEELYHIALEETMETMAHLMLGLTSVAAWRQSGACEAQKENYGEQHEQIYKSAG